MSNRYKGAVISATAPTTTGGPTGVASGAWTLEQQMQLQAAGLWPSQPPPTYIEDVFSTYLYTGNNSTQTITNNINLSGKGGMVWLKDRSSAWNHFVIDTVRGAGYVIIPNSSQAQPSIYSDFNSFTSTGFILGSPNNTSGINASPDSYVSWTFQEQAKFFDVVTWTGNATNRTIAHNLGSVPGSIIVKRTDTTADWAVYHRSLANTQYLVLNSTAAAATGATWWNSTTPTSAVFSVGTDASVNASGGTYVAYIFAHDAGGFGLTGTDNVISCGTFTPSGGEATVNLGYEPQWILWKNADGAYGWFLLDNMRGIATDGDDQRLVANLSNAEGAAEVCSLTSTGFKAIGQVSGNNYIYIAIRRGPMAVPTVGTSVFSPNQTSGTTGTPITTGFPIDWQIIGINAGNGSNQRVSTRLTGVNTDGSSNSQLLITTSTAAEAATGSLTLNWGNTGFQVPSLNSGSPIIAWNFKRAPSVFDVVCYTGTGVATTQTHNLAAVPELMIVKGRSSAGTFWIVYAAALGNTGALVLNATDAVTNSNVFWNSTTPTSSVFTVANGSNVNGSGTTFVNYLFATCAGVSKVGSYTGTGTTLQVDCGFTAGSRFVLIKRTDSTGDWYVWDSARGIVAGNDPYLLLNTTAAEVTGTDYVDTYNAGFEISSTAPAAINASAGTYIFLAIA